jgi:hypothetical protein
MAAKGGDALMAVAIVVTEQAVYPPRVVVAVSGLTPGDELVVYREQAGDRTIVRAGGPITIVDPGFITVDSEMPFGVMVRYVAVVNGVDEYASSLDTYTLPGGNAVLSDAISGRSAEVQISADGGRSYGRDSARFRVGGRNLVVSGPWSAGGEGSYELFLINTVARDNLMALLATATEGVVQLRQPGLSAATGDPYDGVDAYLAVDGAKEARWSQDGSDPRRLITIDFAEVEGWSADLQSRRFTYGEVESFYAGLTYLDAAGDFATYFDAAQGDFS